MKLRILFSIFAITLSAYGRVDMCELASYEAPKRLLFLDGDDGTVACRIYGNLMSSTIPRFSDNGTLESATRSLLRMNNLTAVRGVPGASMVGPADYLGNLEEPHKYLYTIEDTFPPVFYRQAVEEYTEKASPLRAFDDRLATVVKAHWVSGKDTDAIREKNREYRITPKQARQSLFPDPGLLEIDRPLVSLQDFDPRSIDFSSFKARLVKNSEPFQITTEELPSYDDYRLVTYLYEPFYANWQIEHGSGLFLEKHIFSQTITPLSADSYGFVTLARRNKQPDELELIAIQIPYGYTLIIEEGCIHGDTTLNGFFMMGMTSYHTTMQTADTVFLKYPGTRENVKMVLVGQEEQSQDNPTYQMPYVIYNNATWADRAAFRRTIAGQSIIFNPFSKESWYW